MTGLILAGVDLLTAIRYQIVVVDMLLAATALAALATARLAEHALFDHAHRLAPYSKRLAQRLRTRPSTAPRRGPIQAPSITENLAHLGYQTVQ
jgi:putative ABC transport system permease protein